MYVNETGFQPYDPLKSIFDDFMYREKSIIKDYWTDEEFEVIFRQNADRNQMNDNSTIFYYAEENINAGSLLNVFDEYYLTLNKQAIENKIYKQSDLVKCNTIIYSFSGGKEIVMPTHMIGLNSPYGNSSNVITTVGGVSEFITQFCELSDGIKIGSYFYASDKRYSVTNKISTGDILHLYAKVEADTQPPTYTLDINLNDSYRVGSSETLIAVAKRTEQSKIETVTNATILWESSNTGIVSFDKDGVASFKNVGECEIVAIWKEHNIAQTGIINVTSGLVKKCEIAYSGAAEIKAGGSAKSFTAYFYNDNDEIDTSVAPVWSFEYLAAGQEGNVVITETSGNLVKVQAKDKAPVGTNVNLVVTDSYGEYNTRISIDVIDLW